MTTIETAELSTANRGGSHPLVTVGAWITTSDHKRLGRMMFGLGLLALIGISVVGGLVTLERIDVDTTTLRSGSIEQLLSLSRVGLAFFAVLPIVLGLALAIVPLQLGARALAFPRLAAAGFWAWFLGMDLVIVSIAANGGPGGGTSKYVALFISSFGVMLGGLTAIAISLATTILTTRAPGMNMRRVPMFSWSVLVTALGLVVMLPVVIGATIYVYVSYRYNRVPFGGNVGILDWTGFSLTQPQTYLYALPAVGFFAEVVPVAARRRMPKRQFVLAGLGLVGVSSIAGVTQLPHVLPWAGSKLYLGHFFWTKVGDLLDFGLFNVLPVLGAVIVFLLAPLAFVKTRPKITAPFVFGLFGVLMILAGMVGGILYGVLDLGLQGTVFEEGSYTYVGYGAVLASLGAIAYWGPKLWGRKIDDKKAIPLALLGLLGAVLASLPYYIAGFADQPAGAVSFDYSGPHALWNTLATIGHGLMALTVLAFAGLALKSFNSGETVGDDPWNAATLEWATSSPAPENNFAEIHTVMSPEPLLDLKPENA
jgi:heme/copper-type cytochrome/quinol oxidase subunit 1